MHKSGTTLVSQILHHSGINMGEIDERVGYDKGNQYERESTWRLNDDILGSRGLLSIDIAAPQTLRMTEDQRQRMRNIIADCNQTYLDWGFKDPRTTLTYPLWAEELPAHKIIAIYRPVDQLWQRYRPKLHRRYRDFKMARKLVERWTEHNHSLIQILSSTPHEYAVFEFGDLMRVPEEFARFQAFSGRELVDQRRHDLYRRRNSGRSLPLDVAKWTVSRQRGLSVETILEQLNDLRKQAVYV
jgi:hypothetical protein